MFTIKTNKFKTTFVKGQWNFESWRNLIIESNTATGLETSQTPILEHHYHNAQGPPPPITNKSSPSVYNLDLFTWSCMLLGATS